VPEVAGELGLIEQTLRNWERWPRFFRDEIGSG